MRHIFLLSAYLWQIYALLLVLSMAACRMGYRHLYTTAQLQATAHPATFSAMPPAQGWQNSKNNVTPLGCNNPAFYTPDTIHPEHTPVRFLKVVFHFVNSTDTCNNFDEPTARKFAQLMLQAATYKLHNNKRMHLPLGNTTPVLPIRYEYVLTGCGEGNDGYFFHYDDSLSFVNKNIRSTVYSSNLYEKYGVCRQDIINIFFVGHPPDSISSPTYKSSGDGIGMSDWVKMIGAYDVYKRLERQNVDNPFENTAYSFAHLLNHELGHSLGLAHTYNQEDGCEDTPKNPNCWNYEDKAPCDTQVSNNYMDYNAFRDALTPCQLGKIHSNLSRPEYKNFRRKLVPTWCDYRADSTIYIRAGDTITWQACKDIQGDLVLEPGAFLTVKCTLSLPPNGKICVAAGATLVLDNCVLTTDCPNANWQGIFLEKKRNVRKTGVCKAYGAARLEKTTAGVVEISP